VITAQRDRPDLVVVIDTLHRANHGHGHRSHVLSILCSFHRLDCKLILPSKRNWTSRAAVVHRCRLKNVLSAISLAIQESRRSSMASRFTRLSSASFSSCIRVYSRPSKVAQGGRETVLSSWTIPKLGTGTPSERTEPKCNRISAPRNQTSNISLPPRSTNVGVASWPKSPKVASMVMRSDLSLLWTSDCILGDDMKSSSRPDMNLKASDSRSSSTNGANTISRSVKSFGLAYGSLRGDRAHEHVWVFLVYWLR
jgi:hypothetical protein